jgi:putative ABC transport system permease protein
MVMVAASTAPLAILGGILGVPAGINLDHLFMVILGTVAGGNDIPPEVYQVFGVWEILAIPLAAVAIAVVAALIPGRWAARTNVIEVLHAE